MSETPKQAYLHVSPGWQINLRGQMRGHHALWLVSLHGVLGRPGGGRGLPAGWGPTPAGPDSDCRCHHILGGVVDNGQLGRGAFVRVPRANVHVVLAGDDGTRGHAGPLLLQALVLDGKLGLGRLTGYAGPCGFLGLAQGLLRVH